MNLNRKLGLGAAALLVAAAGGAAFAHPHPDGDGDGKKVERVIILRDGAGHPAGSGERLRRFEIIRDGKGEHHAEGPRVRRFEMHGDGALVDCGGSSEKIVDESAGEGDKKTKVVICSRGAPTVETARHLEEALARITANDDLSDEQKARIETALRSAIDRARNAR